MRDEIIAIEEECHGIIGVAESYKAAVDCVIDWGCERPITEEEKENICTWDMNKFNEMFDGQFQMYYIDLWR